MGEETERSHLAGMFLDVRELGTLTAQLATETRYLSSLEDWARLGVALTRYYEGVDHYQKVFEALSGSRIFRDTIRADPAVHFSLAPLDLLWPYACSDGLFGTIRRRYKEELGMGDRHLLEVLGQVVGRTGERPRTSEDLGDLPYHLKLQWAQGVVTVMAGVFVMGTSVAMGSLFPDHHGIPEVASYLALGSVAFLTGRDVLHQLPGVEE